MDPALNVVMQTCTVEPKLHVCRVTRACLEPSKKLPFVIVHTHDNLGQADGFVQQGRDAQASLADLMHVSWS
jgi:hypothetical protein